MIIVGFVLLVAAAVVAIALIVQNPATVTVHAFTWSWDVDMRWLFVAGLALTAIAVVGLAMMRLGGARHARLRRERKALAHENDRLVAERAKAQAANDRPPAGYPARSAPPPAGAPMPPAMPPAMPAEQPTQTMPAASGSPMPQRNEVRPPAPTSTAPAGTPGPAAAPADRPVGGVAAPERASATSAEPHGFRERLSAARHRHVKE